MAEDLRPHGIDVNMLRVMRTTRGSLVVVPVAPDGTSPSLASVIGSSPRPGDEPVETDDTRHAASTPLYRSAGAVRRATSAARSAAVTP